MAQSKTDLLSMFPGSQLKVMNEHEQISQHSALPLRLGGTKEVRLSFHLLVSLLVSSRAPDHPEVPDISGCSGLGCWVKGQRYQKVKIVGHISGTN